MPTIMDMYANLNQFKQIYDESGKEINPMPEDKLITVYCKGSSDEGFADNIHRIDLGITALIAVSWIEQDELVKLCTI